jgi:hypothetical protein
MASQSSGGGSGRFPPGFDAGWVKLKGAQGYRDPQGNVWKLDRLHKDHWDVIDLKGSKIREIGFDGEQIWPGGSKNRGKRAP